MYVNSASIFLLQAKGKNKKKNREMQYLLYNV